jgi:hypothetical protein
MKCATIDDLLYTEDDFWYIVMILSIYQNLLNFRSLSLNSASVFNSNDCLWITVNVNYE